MSKTRIIEAVKRLDLDATKALLKEKPSLLAVTDRDGRNLLLLACSVPCADLRVPETTAARMVKFLLDSGLDVNSRMTKGSAAGCNSVWYAVAKGRNRTLVKLLIDRGAEPQGMFAAGWYEDLKMLDLLIRSGSPVDVVVGATPFHMCWFYRKFEAARFLARKGANVNFIDRRGKTPLHYGVEKEFDPALLKFLVEQGASPDIPDRDGVTARQKAARKRDKRFLEALS